MKKNLPLFGAALLLAVQNAHAGIIAIPPSTAAVPIDSPWVILGLAVSLAVIGGRILHNRKK
ncbi:MAG: hypothetical protein R3228_09880 [Halioglobus sp.]|nr:hypothetical protein [Halioglobus sp.]